MTYDRLRGGSGIQWPCTEDTPDGTERLYTDGRFNTDSDYCETYGHDLDTGAEHTAEEHRAKQPAGRAFLHAAQYQPSPETPSEKYPLLLNTGRTVYQFHTRTKTGRVPQLNDAAPDAWVELNPQDATGLGIGEADLVEVASVRGAVQLRARVCDVRPGTVFIPFHYGYWDQPDDAAPRAANELTLTVWDPVSKQPIYKVAAVRVTRLSSGDAEVRR
jgi:predicted molibdopterin-dependent oxidoreductase YjgC